MGNEPSVLLQGHEAQASPTTLDAVNSPSVQALYFAYQILFSIIIKFYFMPAIIQENW